MLARNVIFGQGASDRLPCFAPLSSVAHSLWMRQSHQIRQRRGCDAFLIRGDRFTVDFFRFGALDLVRRLGK